MCILRREHWNWYQHIDREHWDCRMGGIRNWCQLLWTGLWGCVGRDKSCECSLRNEKVRSSETVIWPGVTKLGRSLSLGQKWGSSSCFAALCGQTSSLGSFASEQRMSHREPLTSGLHLVHSIDRKGFSWCSLTPKGVCWELAVMTLMVWAFSKFLSVPHYHLWDSSRCVVIFAPCSILTLLHMGLCAFCIWDCKDDEKKAHLRGHWLQEFSADDLDWWQ